MSHRKNNLKKRYGLTPEEVEAMWLVQKKRCAATGWPIEMDRTKGPAAVVDHCHATGKVRGLLHPSANLALGHLRESVVAISGCLEYIEKTNKETE